VKLRVGQTLYSIVDDTTVVVVRAPDADVAVTCGGAELTETKPEAAPADTPSGAGTQLGKRYADETLGIELLCTKAGSASLEVNGVPLPLKEAKPLPASD
jgi:hypothetical protein